MAVKAKKKIQYWGTGRRKKAIGFLTVSAASAQTY